MVVDHENVEVSNLHWQVIHTKGRRGTIKSMSVRNSMRALNPTILLTTVTDPLTWENAMDIGRGNDCVVDIRDHPRTQYLINGAHVLVEREPKKSAITNGISGRGGGPILMVSGSAMGTEGRLMVYNHWWEGVLLMPITQAQPYDSDN